MDYGLFIPITNGSIPSVNAPRYRPSFELNRDVCRRGETYGFRFALSLVKLRGFGGRFFQLSDCVCNPTPKDHIPLISAGTSDRGRQFAADYCDYNFTVVAGGVDGAAAASVDLQQRAAKAGRTVTTYLTTTVIL